MQNSQFSIRTIYILLTIVYYLLVLVIIFRFISGLGVLFGFWGPNTLPSFDIPLEARFKEVGEVVFMSEKMNVEFVKASGSLRFVDAPQVVVQFGAIYRIVVMPIIFWQVHLFYIFIRNVKNGRIFDVNNLKILRKLSYVLIGMWFFRVVYNYTLINVFFKEIQFKNIVFSSTDGVYLSALLFGLFTWVLSHIFLKGLELQEENELTV